MVVFKLSFSEEEMILFFKHKGFVLTEVEWIESMPVYHNRFEDRNMRSVCIVNPHNCKTIPVSVAFEKVILKVRNAVLLESINKLTVLEALR